MSQVKVNKVVVAYSGGLDTSVIIPWLKENYDCEVVAFVADVGQGDEELEGVEEKAIASGASEVYIRGFKRADGGGLYLPIIENRCRVRR